MIRNQQKKGVRCERMEGREDMQGGKDVQGRTDLKGMKDLKGRRGGRVSKKKREEGGYEMICKVGRKDVKGGKEGHDRKEGCQRKEEPPAHSHETYKIVKDLTFRGIKTPRQGAADGTILLQFYRFLCSWYIAFITRVSYPATMRSPLLLHHSLLLHICHHHQNLGLVIR